MIAALDSSYTDEQTQTGVVLFRNWSNSEAAGEYVCRTASRPSAYQPGEFYRRELPVILEAIEPHLDRIKAIVVDGYVWLDDQQRPGLGAHLYKALDQNFAVIGVAKNYFQGSCGAEVRRGTSKHPIFVTAAGIDQEAAAKCVADMAGDYRIPTLLKRVDQLSKSDG